MAKTRIKIIKNYYFINLYYGYSDDRNSNETMSCIIDYYGARSIYE